MIEIQLNDRIKLNFFSEFIYFICLFVFVFNLVGEYKAIPVCIVWWVVVRTEKFSVTAEEFELLKEMLSIQSHFSSLRSSSHETALY